MEQLIAQAFEKGGMALAFVIMLWAYRELWQRRFDELEKVAKERDVDRKILLDAITADTVAKEKLANVLETATRESRESRARMEVVASEIKNDIDSIDKEWTNIRAKGFKQYLTEAGAD